MDLHDGLPAKDRETIKTSTNQVVTLQKWSKDECSSGTDEVMIASPTKIEAINLVESNLVPNYFTTVALNSLPQLHPESPTSKQVYPSLALNKLNRSRSTRNSSRVSRRRSYSTSEISKWEEEPREFEYSKRRRSKKEHRIRRIHSFGCLSHCSSTPLQSHMYNSRANPNALTKRELYTHVNYPESAIRLSNCGKFKDSFYLSRRKSHLSNFLHRRSSVKKITTPTKFTENDILCAGYLKKMGTWRQNWKKRFFILRYDKPLLCYYDNTDDLKTLGEIEIGKNDMVIDQSNDEDSSYVFEYRSSCRVLLLEATTKFQKFHWIQVLENCITRLKCQVDDKIYQLPMEMKLPVSIEVDPSSTRDIHLTHSDRASTCSIGTVDDRWDEESVRSKPCEDHPRMDKIVYVSVELDLGHANNKDHGCPYFISLEYFQDNEWREVERTEFQHLDGNRRRKFFVLLPIDNQDASDFRFGIVQLSNEAKGYKSSLECVGYANCSLASLSLDNSQWMSLPLELQVEFIKPKRSVCCQRTDTCSLTGALLVNVVSKDTLENEVLTSGKVVATQKYVVETSSNGFALSEKLVVPNATFSVPIAFLYFLIEEKKSKMTYLKELMNTLGLASLGLGPSVDIQVKGYEAMIDEYQKCVTYYEKLEKHFNESEEPVFKRSNMKSDWKWRFVPTNLQNEVLQAHTSGLQINTWNTVTFGCAAAHFYGFHCGGARKLQEKVEKTVSRYNQDSVSHCNRVLTLEMRLDIVHSQALAAAVATVSATVELAAQGSVDHRRTLTSMASIGYLLSIESLLSTHGKELGMLEDMHAAMKFLNSISFQFILDHEITTTGPTMKSMRKDGSDSCVISLAVCRRTFVSLPSSLRNGKHVQLFAVLFTQGINEMQTIANAVRRCRLQEIVNNESLSVLNEFCHIYRNAHKDDEDPREVNAIFDMLNIIDQLVTNSKFEKNVNILVLTSDLCRKLSAGRMCCCKSGKDRTAMSVTLEQARVLSHKLGVLRGREFCQAMRLCGVRRHNVFLNTRNNKFAFNKLQHKLLPDCYKPPPGTYASGKA